MVVSAIFVILFKKVRICMNLRLEELS